MEFEDTCRLAMISLIILMFFIIVGFVVIIGETYIGPVADERANNHCIMLGFDQYNDYSCVGFFSKEPIAIKCEYSEKYTDIVIRTNEQE